MRSDYTTDTVLQEKTSSRPQTRDEERANRTPKKGHGKGGKEVLANEKRPSSPSLKTSSERNDESRKEGGFERVDYSSHSSCGEGVCTGQARVSLDAVSRGGGVQIEPSLVAVYRGEECKRTSESEKGREGERKQREKEHQ